jgi:glutathione S-transferase
MISKALTPGTEQQKSPSGLSRAMARQTMIDLHYAPTPNGWKISIMLEELGIPYQVIPVNIRAGEQFKPEFLAISPNNRIPAIVDHAPADGGGPFSVFETGAILIYLAEKTGRFLPADMRGRSKVVQWVMWQMGGLGPMLGQHGHLRSMRRRKFPMRSSAIATRRRGFIACSIPNWAKPALTSPAITQSPTSPAFPGP